jgi:hypothetical protein
MSEHEFLDERRQALEEQFFAKENAEKLDALKEELAEQDIKSELRKASGMTDDAVLEKLVGLGLRGETVVALSLVPLISVAWADGAIQDNERNAILQGAKGKGIEEGSASFKLLSSWLEKKPDASLFDAWQGYIKSLIAALTDEQTKLLRTQIVGFARMVAESAGGFLGFAKVAASEEKVLDQIAAAFTK